MSKRLPGIWFAGGVRTIITLKGAHDHSPDGYYRGPSVVVCDDSSCRAELVSKGGVEMVERTWYIARDRTSITIGQSDGRSHLHEPHGKDYTVTCASPDCNAFFQLEYDTMVAAKRNGDVWGGCCGVSAATRPRTALQIGEAQEALAERAREEAAIEIELGRQRRAALYPTRQR